MKTRNYILLIFILGVYPTLGFSHQEGFLRRQPIVSFGDCSIRKQEPGLELSVKYLNGLARYLLSKNPLTFYGGYSFEKLCFRVDRDSAFNAGHVPTYGLVKLNTGFLLEAPNDAAVLAAISHEISHLTLRHNDAVDESARLKVGSFTNTIMHPKVLSSLEWHQAQFLYEASRTHAEKLGEQSKINLSQLETLITDIHLKEKIKNTLPWIQTDWPPFKDISWNTLYWPSSERHLITDIGKYSLLHPLTETKIRDLIFQLKNNLNSRPGILNGMNEAISKLFSLPKAILSEEERVNWIEEEADESGLELYLKAGLPFDQFGWYLEKIIQLRAGTFSALSTCLTQIEQGIVPERGIAQHPSPCWRLFNIHREYQKHQKYYEQFEIKTTTIPDLPFLSDVKREIHNSKANSQKEYFSD